MQKEIISNGWRLTHLGLCKYQAKINHSLSTGNEMNDFEIVESV